jgi:hypothetical protein
MQFNHFLSSYLPDLAYGGKRLLDDMVEQTKLADRLGYRGVTIPEHHLINILLTPSPLQMAVKVAAETEHLELMTSVVVLPLHDMRMLAGEIAQADTLCDGRSPIHWRTPSSSSWTDSSTPSCSRHPNASPTTSAIFSCATTRRARLKLLNGNQVNCPT